ncbi:hypothetical protein D3C76_444150 [compost metagenome]
MKARPLATAILLGLFTLTGCNGDKAPSSAEVQRNWVNVAALPIIQEAVFSLAPSFNGQRNPQIMEQVCGLATGEFRQEQVNAFLEKQHVDAARIPREGSSLSLLVNGDKASQTTACAAHLATTVLSPVDAGEIMTLVYPTPAPEKDKPLAEADSGKARKKDKVEQETTVSQPAAPVLKLDNARLNQALPMKMAEARANADVFALIAAELQRHPGQTVSEYRKQVRELFVRLAPVYLQRIKLQLPPANVTYKVTQIDAERFSFNSSTGASYEYSNDGMTLRQNGVIWYGQGKLLGQEYPLQVSYFPESVNSLLAPEAK